MHMEKELFRKQGLVRRCPHEHYPVMHTVCFSSSSLSLGQEHPLTKPSRMGNGRGGGAAVVLGKQDCKAGEAPASAQPSPGLWPRQSFWWCTSGFTWARNRQPCWLSKHPSHRTLLSDPLGSSDRLRVLCASLSRAHCVLWAFPLYFHSALHSAMPWSITSFQINGPKLNSRTGSSPPASLLQANVAPVCEEGLWPIDISYPNPAAAYSNPFPSPTLSHKKREDAERQQVLELEEDVVWQPRPAPLLHPSWQKVNKQIKEFFCGPLKTKKIGFL